MGQIWWIGLLATFLGVSLGGVMMLFIHEYKRSLGTVYALCTGLLLALLSFSIIPEVLEIGSWIILISGFLVGMLFFEWIHRVLSLKLERIPEMKTGVLLLIMITFHNFPIGALLGAHEQSDLSQSLLQTLVVHNIPEGMILFAFLFVKDFRFIPFVVYAFIVAVPVAVGAVIGEWIEVENMSIWAFFMSITVGTIYKVTMKEILPEAVKHSSNFYGLLITTITFLLVGLYFIYF